MIFLIIGYRQPQKVLNLLQVLFKKADKTDNIIVSIDSYNKHKITWTQIEHKFDNEDFSIEWIKHKTNLGLEKHVIQACNYAASKDDFLYLEEDVVITANSINYVKLLQKYSSNLSDVRQVSLSSIEWDELNNRFWLKNKKGLPIFKAQLSSSWGVFYKKEWWNEFISKTNFKEQAFPHKTLKSWAHSWKKYHITFLVENNYFTLYPGEHLAIHEGEQGTNTKAFVRNFSRTISENFEIRLIEIVLKEKISLEEFDINLNYFGKEDMDSTSYFLRSIPLLDIIRHIATRYLK